MTENELAALRRSRVSLQADMASVHRLLTKDLTPLQTQEELRCLLLDLTKTSADVTAVANALEHELEGREPGTGAGHLGRVYDLDSKAGALDCMEWIDDDG